MAKKEYKCTQCGNTDQSLMSDEYIFNIPKSDKHITLDHVSNGHYTGYTQCEECGSELIEELDEPSDYDD